MIADVRPIAGFVRRHVVAIAACVLFVAVGVLGFLRLDNTPFWDDEAYVGIYARNYLTTGKLTGWDGRNLASFRNGGVMDQNLITVNPPLDCLVGALSFRLLGQSTWSGRFPFVVAGLIALGVFALIVRRDFHEHPVLSLYALAVLGLSVVFLLNIRQCRYYSLGLLFALTGYETYRRCLWGGRLSWYLGFAAAMIGLFYSSFLYCAAFAGTLAVTHLVFHRHQFRRKDLWKLAVAVACIAAATVPYAIQHRIWHRPDIVSEEPWYLHKTTLLWSNVRELNTLGLPWMIAGLWAVIWVFRWRKDGSFLRVLEYAVLGIGFTLFTAMLSPQPVHGAERSADVRYLLPAVPFLTVLVASALYEVHRYWKAPAGLLFLAIVTTNLPSAHPWGWEFQWLLPAYVNEVTHDYPTSYGEVVDYLRNNARQDDLVFAWPEYTNYPIMYYLGNRVKLCCLLNSRDPAATGQSGGDGEGRGPASGRSALPRLDRVLRASSRMREHPDRLLPTPPARLPVQPDELQPGGAAGCLLVCDPPTGTSSAPLWPQGRFQSQ